MGARATFETLDLEALVLEGTSKRLAELQREPKTDAVAEFKKSVAKAEAAASRVADALLRMGTPSEELFSTAEDDRG